LTSPVYKSGSSESFGHLRSNLFVELCNQTFIMKRCIGTLLKSKHSLITKILTLFIFLQPIVHPLCLIFMFVLLPANLSRDFSEFWFLVPIFVLILLLNVFELGKSYFLFAFPVMRNYFFLFFHF